MVNWIDGAIGRVVTTIKAKGMYENMLIVFSSDNGGPLGGGGNNYPLKGGKFSNWEGGIRVNAFVSGGIVPLGVRGTTTQGLVAGWDWYSTLAHLAGADPTDHSAAAAGLPPIDSVNVWPLISGATDKSPRTQVVIGSNVGGEKGRTKGEATALKSSLPCFDAQLTDSTACRFVHFLRPLADERRDARGVTAVCILICMEYAVCSMRHEYAPAVHHTHLTCKNPGDCAGV
jgi:hypothetical protein